MVDPVPTRAERIAAVVGILLAAVLVPAAVLGSRGAAIALVAVVLVVGSITNLRTTVRTLLIFGLRSVDDDPAAERYRERRRRRDERIRDALSVEYDPRWDRLLAAGLAVVGIGALAAVATGIGDELGVRNTTRLLVVALIALNCSLVAYAASYIDVET